MDRTEAEKLFEGAEGHLKKGRYLKALSFYQKLLQHPQVSPPGLEEAFNRVGECYLNLQIYGEAEDYLRQAAALNPFHPEPHYLLGILFTKTARWAEAVFELKLARQLQPKEPTILRALGWALFLTGQGRAGERALKSCLQINQKDLYAYCDLAVLYLNTAAFAKAEETIAQAEKIAPRHPLLLSVKNACVHFKSLKNNWRRDWVGEAAPPAPANATLYRAKTLRPRPPELPPVG